MNEILQECKVIGFKPCTIKETREEMIRICIEINSKKEGYYGNEAKYIFLPDTQDRQDLLKKAIDDKSINTFLKVAVDIINNNSKVNDIIIK